jgi:hypothetical protein
MARPPDKPQLVMDIKDLTKMIKERPGHTYRLYCWGSSCTSCPGRQANWCSNLHGAASHDCRYLWFA